MHPTKLASTSTTIRATGGQPQRFVARLVACVRFPEVLALQGSPLVGAFLAMQTVTVQHGVTLMILAVGSFCLVAHVFLLNDWAGIEGDLAARHRATRAFTTRNVTRTEVGWLALGMLAVGVALLGYLGRQRLGSAWPSPALARCIRCLSSTSRVCRSPARSCMW